MSYSAIDFHLPLKRARSRQRVRREHTGVRVRWDRIAILGAALGLWVPIIAIVHSLL